MAVKINLVIAVLSGVGLLTGSCSSHREPGREDSAIPVKTVLAEPVVTIGTNEFIGMVEEEVALSLSFPIQGKIEKIGVTEGQYVSRGVLLARLDRTSLESTHQAALSSLKQARDALNRLQLLYDNQSLPEIKYIEAQTKLEQARSMEEIARKNLEDSRMEAPFSGVIGLRAAEPGEHVLPNQQVLSLLDIGTVKVKIPVPEKEISRIGKGDEASVSVAALNNKIFPGKVIEKGVVADPVSHTYAVRIRVENGNRELLPGMVCRVKLEREGETGLIALPVNSIQRNASGEQFVWCVAGDLAVRKAVKTGNLTGAGVIVKAGLSGGEVVVTEGYHKMYEGAKVSLP
ncbi:MAG: efflux RND transporter periplasmic adaptor subunit [Mangrovibacterium sp.]